MTTFLLLHGAGSDSWYWHRVLPLLPDALAVDLPVTDDSCGFEEYADRAASGITGVASVRRAEPDGGRHDAGTG